MATSLATSSGTQSLPRPGASWLWLIIAWQAVLAVLTLGAAAGMAAGQLMPDSGAVVRWVLAVVLAVLGLASAYGAWALFRRQPLGRVAAILCNYLTVIGCVLVAGHVLGLYVGLDTLANTFGSGVPFLGIVFLGYLVSAAGDRFEGRPQERLFRDIGRWVMLAGLLLFFYFINTLGFLVWLPGQLIAQPLAIGLLVLAAICLAALWMAWNPGIAAELNASHMQEELLNGYIFLSPNLLGFLLFFAGPLALSLWISLTTSEGAAGDRFVGLDNYARIFQVTVAGLPTPEVRASDVIDVTTYTELWRTDTFLVAAREPRFWVALRNTLLFVLMAVPLSVIPALILAAVLNSKLPGMGFYRALYFIPSIAAVVGIALVWRWMYDSTIGWINYFITLGINALNTIGFSLTDPNVQWLNQTTTALLAVVIMAVWQTTGFNSVLFLAGLQNVPGELYEAATVDGAGAVQKFWSITLPLLAPTTFFVVSTTMIAALQVFEQVYILTNPPGSPSDSTLTLVLYLYQEGFNQFDFGFASAVAWVLFAVIFGFTFVQFQRNRQSSIYEN